MSHVCGMGDIDHPGGESVFVIGKYFLKKQYWRNMYLTINARSREMKVNKSYSPQYPKIYEEKHNGKWKLISHAKKYKEMQIYSLMKAN